MRRHALAIVAVAAIVASAAARPLLAQSHEAQPPSESYSPAPQRWFAGGGFGASFGTVDSVSIAPLIGLHVTPRIDVGTQLYYRWIDDGRYSPSVSTDDYGVSVFARARVIEQLFVEADVQYSNYEYITDVGTTRASYTSFLAGGGYMVPMGHGASFYISALYDFGYDDDDPFRPYDDPWRVQIGAAVGF